MDPFYQPVNINYSPTQRLLKQSASNKLKPTKTKPNHLYNTNMCYRNKTCYISTPCYFELNLQRIDKRQSAVSGLATNKLLDRIGSFLFVLSFLYDGIGDHGAGTVDR